MRKGKFQLPKFHDRFSLGLGVLFGIVLIIDAVWSILAQYQDPFFPFHLGRAFRIVFGFVLSIHCLDMLKLYKKHRIVRIVKSKNERQVYEENNGEISNNWLFQRMKWWFDAIRFAWRETKFRAGVLVCTAGIVLGLLCGIGMTELVLLVAIATLGWGLEIANTSIEMLLDLVHPRYSNKVKIIKDAFASVPIFAYTSYAICWLILVAPRFYDILIVQLIINNFPN